MLNKNLCDLDWLMLHDYWTLELPKLSHRNKPSHVSFLKETLPSKLTMKLQALNLTIEKIIG